jgi:hypothetical protein
MLRTYFAENIQKSEFAEAAFFEKRFVENGKVKLYVTLSPDVYLFDFISMIILLFGERNHSKIAE